MTVTIHASAVAPTMAFHASREAEPHAGRTKAILKAHPEVRALIGRNPWTGAIMAAHFAVQFAIAVGLGALGTGYWWLAVVLAWCIGAFANHNLYIIIHEATHNLIFKSRMANKMVAVIADMPNIIPGALAFRSFHLKHHSNQGDPAVDADLPSEWEARMVGNSALGKSLWLFFFPVFQALRVFRVHGIMPSDGWTIANFVCCIGYGIVLSEVFGFNALLYSFLSFWFSLGLHPLGARWVQEHYSLDPEQETGSYYGWLNRFAMNIGYHNEHHDLPSVPWNRLPELTRMAPEFYQPLTSYPSWTRLLLNFILDPRYSLYSRVVREPSTPA